LASSKEERFSELEPYSQRGGFMKIVFVALALSLLSLELAHGGGRPELANVQEVAVEQIGAIAIRYRSGSVVLQRHDSDTVVVREYLSANNSDFFAGIAHSGNALVIEAGRRPLAGAFRARLEVSIPASFGNVEIKSSSGSVEIRGEFFVSSFDIESSSGRVSVDSVTAGEVSIRSSSGRISVNSVAADRISIRSSSGSIELGSVNRAAGIGAEGLGENAASSVSVASSSGRVSADSIAAGRVSIHSSSGRISVNSVAANMLSVNSSSGAIELGMVSGTADIESSSGSVRGTFTENAGNVSIATGSGSVTVGLPRSLDFNFSSRSSSGSLRTPFDDRLSRPLTDRNSAQGVVLGGNVPGAEIGRDIDIRTRSGSIRVNWVN